MCSRLVSDLVHTTGQWTCISEMQSLSGYSFEAAKLLQFSDTCIEWVLLVHRNTPLVSRNMSGKELLSSKTIW